MNTTSPTVLLPSNLRGITATGTDPWTSAAIKRTPTLAASQVNDIIDEHHIRDVLAYEQIVAPSEGMTFAEAIAEPWRLPGTRLVGSFDTDEVHDCGQIDRALVLWLVNDTDFLDEHGGTRPLNICTLIQFDAQIQRSAPFMTFATAQTSFRGLVSLAQAGCQDSTAC